MAASEDLFVSEQHPVSRRHAVVEDDGRTAWLYLTEPDVPKPIADCWLYNRVAASGGGVEALRRGMPPVVPATHAAPEGTVLPPEPDVVEVRWSKDGESVAVLFGDELVGFIASGQPRGGIFASRGPTGTCSIGSCSKGCFRHEAAVAPTRTAQLGAGLHRTESTAKSIPMERSAEKSHPAVRTSVFRDMFVRGRGLHALSVLWHAGCCSECVA